MSAPPKHKHKGSPIDALDREIALLEQKVLDSARQLGALRGRLGDRARAEVAEIRDEWDELDTRWWVFVIAALVAFFLFSYLFYMNLGWYADRRVLPPSSDWLLDQIPSINVVPVLSWGWLALHLFALGAAILYLPKKLPFLLLLLGNYFVIRTLYIFLSPIGAPTHILDMRELDTLFSWVAGEYTFQNEFVFSGHTAIPFLFFQFFQSRGLRLVMLGGSIVMAVAVLVTHNHYTVDVLSAYLVGYGIYALSDAEYRRFVRPLYLLRPSL